MNTQIALGITAVLAIPVTAFLCRRRIARKKKVGIPTTLLGTGIPAACMTVLIYVFEMGTESFAHLHGLPLIQVIFSNAFGFCLLPAVLTVIFYQARNKDIHDA